MEALKLKFSSSVLFAMKLWKLLDRDSDHFWSSQLDENRTSFSYCVDGIMSWQTHLTEPAMTNNPMQEHPCNCNSSENHKNLHFNFNSFITCTCRDSFLSCHFTLVQVSVSLTIQLFFLARPGNILIEKGYLSTDDVIKPQVLPQPSWRLPLVG